MLKDRPQDWHLFVGTRKLILIEVQQSGLKKRITFKFIKLKISNTTTTIVVIIRIIIRLK